MPGRPARPGRNAAGGALLLTAVVLAAGSARADGPDARAEALYNEALALADGGKYEAACPKYAESQKLDPALGTQFNLADCYEHVAQLARALSNFVAVERAARAAGKANLAARAHERAARLAPKIPKLKITLAAGTTDATVKVDGVRVTDDTLAALPVDPGEHLVEVSAPGRLTWTKTLSATSGTHPVDVPALESPPAPSAPAPVPATRERERERERDRERGGTPPDRAMTWRVAGLTAAGLGAVGLVIGGVAGMSAIDGRDEARTLCGDSDPKRCHSVEGVRRWDDAQSSGTLSTVAFVSGGLLLAAGAILWFAAPPARARATGRLDPYRGTLGLGGVF